MHSSMGALNFLTILRWMLICDWMIKLAHFSQFDFHNLPAKTGVNNRMQQKCILLLGAPGSGKGTQAKRLSERHGIPHISTGDLARHEIEGNTDLGKQIKPVIDRGELLNNDMMYKLLCNRIKQLDCKHGFILDGFPRNIEQVKLLDHLFGHLQIERVIMLHLEINIEVAKRRLSGRLIHTKSGRTYHKTDNPPINPMKDDITNEPLEQRKDDNDNVINSRLDMYPTTMAPVLDYYSKRGILYCVDAGNDQSKVCEDIEAHIKSKL